MVLVVARKQGTLRVASLRTMLIGAPADLRDPVLQRRAEAVAGALLLLLAASLPLTIAVPATKPIAWSGPVLETTMMLVSIPVLLALAYWLSRTRYTLPAAAFGTSATATGAVLATRLHPTFGEPASFLLLLGAVLVLGVLVMPWLHALTLALINMAGAVAVRDWMPAIGSSGIEIPYLFLGVNAFAIAIYGALRHSDLRLLHGESALRRQLEAQQGVLLDRVPVGVLVVQGGRIASANAAALDLLGAKRRLAVEGRDVAELLDLEGAVLTRLRRDPGHGVIPLESFPCGLLRIDGDRTCGQIFPAVIPFNGHPAWSLLVLEPTDRSRADELTERVRGLEERLLARARLLEDAAYGMADPLTPLVLEAQMLRKQLAQRPEAASVEALERNLLRMVRLAQALLDVARLQQGELRVRTQTVPVQAILENVQTSLRGISAAEIQVEWPEAPRGSVHADPERLQLALYHIIHYAHQRGRSRLRVEVTLGDDVLFGVHCDNIQPLEGPPEALPLHLASELSRALGGHFSVHASPEGTTYALSVPPGRAAEMAAA
jgi:signal transduction histidine kinase